jgi:hypothetical protein
VEVEAMSIPPYTPQSKTELYEVLARVFFGAPDQFLQLPNMRPGEEVTLDTSFAELRRGVDHVFRRAQHAVARTEMHELLTAMYNEFNAGRRKEGRIMCHQFEALVKRTRP